jgi:hypothetical protein
MRGKRASIAKKKVDLILVAIRLESAGKWVEVAQGYERRGVVWSDMKLFSRDEIIARLEAGDRVFTGKLGSLEGDFDLSNRVHLEKGREDVRLLVRENSSSGDDLELPLF